jgi:hypothetical protein
MPATLGEPDGVMRLADVVGQVTHAGEDVRVELPVTAYGRELVGPVEVLPSGRILSSVVRHPSGHFCQGSGGCEGELPVAAVSVAKELWRYLGVEIPDHCGIERATPHVPVGRTE